MSEIEQVSIMSPETVNIKQRQLQKLSRKEQRFVDEYLKDLNGTKALLRAGFRAKNEKSAGTLAARLLAKVGISQAVEQRTQTLAERAGIDTVEVLREAARLSFSDAGKLFDENGQLIPIHKLPEDIRRCVASVRVKELWDGRGADRQFMGYETEVRLWDKNAAQHRLFKHLMLYPEQPGSKDNPIQINHTFDLRGCSNDELARIRKNPESVILSTGN